eukprot:5945297-Pyramimonas_sp.AAC.1
MNARASMDSKDVTIGSTSPQFHIPGTSQMILPGRVHNRVTTSGAHLRVARLPISDSFFFPLQNLRHTANYVVSSGTTCDKCASLMSGCFSDVMPTVVLR